MATTNPRVFQPWKQGLEQPPSENDSQDGPTLDSRVGTTETPRVFQPLFLRGTPRVFQPYLLRKVEAAHAPLPLPPITQHPNCRTPATRKP